MDVDVHVVSLRSAERGTVVEDLTWTRNCQVPPGSHSNLRDPKASLQ